MSTKNSQSVLGKRSLRSRDSPLPDERAPPQPQTQRKLRVRSPRIEDPEAQHFIGRMQRRWPPGAFSDEQHLQAFKDKVELAQRSVSDFSPLHEAVRSPEAGRNPIGLYELLRSPGLPSEAQRRAIPSEAVRSRAILCSPAMPSVATSAAARPHTRVQSQQSLDPDLLALGRCDLRDAAEKPARVPPCLREVWAVVKRCLKHM